jgi:hypothetical protein
MQLCLKETTSKLTSKEAQKYVDNSSDIALEDIGPIWPDLFFIFYFSLNKIEKYKILFDTISP